MVATVEHQNLMTAAVEARAHQLDALRKCLSQPTLVVLPTGQGKTAIEWMAIAEALNDGGKAILVAPTNPLVDQHLKDLQRVLSIDEDTIVRLSGSHDWQKREKMMSDARVIVTTPQIIRNDTQRGTLNLSTIDLIVFDEAHHATGNHAMAQVGDLYRSAVGTGMVLACTASPGSNEPLVREVIERLGIERIHSLQSNDPLLAPYSQALEVTEVRLEIPEEIKLLAAPIEELLEEHLDKLRRMGFIPGTGPVGMRVLREGQRRISMAIGRGNPQGYNAAKMNADSIRIHTLLGLLLAQGPMTALRYLERAEVASREGDRKQARFIGMPRIRGLIALLKSQNPKHPKMERIRGLVENKLRQSPECRIIIFTNYRDTMDVVATELADIDGVRAEKFFGQSKKGGEGLSQKEQVARLQRFKDGEKNILIATSVGEEGLDVPNADLVIFHEPVASEIRTIQRRGRTARHSEGQVVVLVAEDTRDEGIRHASAAREAKMHRVLAKVRRRMPRAIIDDSIEKRLKSFTIQVDSSNYNAGTWMLEENERLAPELKEKEETTKDSVSMSKQRKRTIPSVRPEQLRPRQQMSIDSFLPPPKAEDSAEIEEGDWTKPILDAREEDEG